MGLNVFFRAHPLFHIEELEAHLGGGGTVNKNTLNASLQYHLEKNHLARIRRGYYLVTSHYAGSQVEGDPIAIGAHLAKDTIISHHSALSFHALAYSMAEDTYLFSDKRLGLFTCDFGTYRQVAHPKPLKSGNRFVETKHHDRIGIKVRVCTIERTLVDSLVRPEYSGGWEEIWRSFESLNFLDVDRVIGYADLLGSSITAAKLGFFLEQHQEQFSVTEKQLSQLSLNCPKSGCYMEKGYKGEVIFLKRWNLIVPKTVYEKSWEELGNDFI